MTESTMQAPLEAPSSTRPTVARIRRLRPVWLGLVGLAIITLLFVAYEPSQLFSYNTFLLAIIGAVSLNLLVGTTGLISLGNSSFMAVGAFGTVFARTVHIPFPLDIVVGVVAAGVAGVIIGLPAARLRGFHMALATLAGFFIVDYLSFKFQTDDHAGGAAGFLFSPLYESKGLVGGQRVWAWTLLGVVCLVLLGASRLVRERRGRALRMIRDHEIVAGTLGIPVVRYKLGTFALTSAAIGLQGALFAYLLGSANNASFTLTLSIDFLAMVMIGGADSIAGSVLGAALVTGLPVFVPNLLPHLLGSGISATTGPAVAGILSGLVLVAFIAVAPSGLVSMVRVARRWLVGQIPKLASRGGVLRSQRGQS